MTGERSVSGTPWIALPAAVAGSAVIGDALIWAPGGRLYRAVDGVTPVHFARGHTLLLGLMLLVLARGLGLRRVPHPVKVRAALRLGGLVLGLAVLAEAAPRTSAPRSAPSCCSACWWRWPWCSRRHPRRCPAPRPSGGRWPRWSGTRTAIRWRRSCCAATRRTWSARTAGPRSGTGCSPAPRWPVATRSARGPRPAPRSRRSSGTASGPAGGSP